MVADLSEAKLETTSRQDVVNQKDFSVWINNSSESGPLASTHQRQEEFGKVTPMTLKSIGLKLMERPFGSWVFIR